MSVLSTLLTFLLAASSFVHVHAQLALPNPPYLPPSASFGAQPSNNSAQVNAQWSTLLGNLLFFYDAQRSGRLPADERVAWRNDSALGDGQDVGLDLTGGYYDAGDYIKCTFPLSFTLMSVCWGALDFGKAYDQANQTAYLDDMLRWGLDWLIKAHPSADILYVQVGADNLDNAYWGGDQGIPTPRPSFQINDTSPGTDAAAQVSAAFAACSALYAPGSANSSISLSGPASLQNASYASTLLGHAQQLYTFAANATGGRRTYQTSVPAVGAAYASSGFGDDLAIAALFLTLANSISGGDASGSDTAAARYADALEWYAQYGLGAQMVPGKESVFNWDSKTPGAIVLGTQLARAYPALAANATSWQGVAETYFDAIVNGTGRGYLTRGGLLYYAGDSDEESLNPALNAAMLMARYASAGLASTPAKARAYLAFAHGQLDYALGKNPMSVPYVVGTHPNSPANPHSALATGAAPGDLADINSVPAREAYVLYGAVVGGPDAHDRFWDLRGDWTQGEAALDYGAPLLALVAFAMLNASGAVDPYYTGVQPGAYARVRPGGWPCDAAISLGCRSGLSTGAKVAVGVVVGVVGAALLAAALWWWFVWRRRRSLRGRKAIRNL